MDTTQLKLFKLIYETRSLTEAAKRFPMSLSKASRTLSSLRDALGDELFLRSENKLFPTQFAVEQYPKIVRLLKDFADIGSRNQFTPEQCSAIFNIGGLDLDLIAFLSPVLKKLKSCAPNIRLHYKNIAGDFYSDLRQGKLDFVLYPTELDMEGYKRLVLCQDRIVFVARSGSSYARAKLQGKKLSERLLMEDLSMQMTFPIQNSENTRMGLFEDNVENSRFSPKLWTPFALSLPFLLQEDEVCTMPYQLACRLKNFFPLEILGAPADLEPYAVTLLWSEKVDKEVSHQWLRSLILATVAEESQSLKDIPELPIN